MWSFAGLRCHHGVSSGLGILEKYETVMDANSKKIDIELQHQAS